MARQKVTLSLDPAIFKRFQEIKTLKGLSISAWVSAKMQEEIVNYELITEQKIFKLLDSLTEEELEEIYEKYLED